MDTSSLAYPVRDATRGKPTEYMQSEEIVAGHAPDNLDLSWYWQGFQLGGGYSGVGRGTAVGEASSASETRVANVNDKVLPLAGPRRSVLPDNTCYLPEPSACELSCILCAYVNILFAKKNKIRHVNLQILHGNFHRGLAFFLHTLLDAGIFRLTVTPIFDA